MSEYILDSSTTLVLNGKVFVLAREKKKTTNNVCSQCSLKRMCNDFSGSNNLLKMCMKPDLDGRWFFLDCQDLSKSDNRDILCNIKNCLNIDF